MMKGKVWLFLLGMNIATYSIFNGYYGLPIQLGGAVNLIMIGFCSAFILIKNNPNFASLNDNKPTGEK